MARKPRNYKAEYAAAKQRATRAGYKSERQYKAVRKSLALPPRTSPIPRKVLERERGTNAVPVASAAARALSRKRHEAKAWSDRHSRVERSKYHPRMSDPQVERYWRAYVDKNIEGNNRLERKREKNQRLYEFLVPDYMTEEEWEQFYRA